MKTRVTVTRVAIRHLKNQRDPASLAAINTLLGTANGSLAKAEDYYKNWQAIPQVKGQNAALTEEMQKARKNMHEVMRLSIAYLRADNYQAYGDRTPSRRRMRWRRSIPAGARKTTSC